jgi:predicted DNA-binding transcriptional regulator AlpA
LLPGAAATTARLEVLRGGKDGLLSVREAVHQLGLCTATVYGLCAEGALPHIRILNAIRIAPAEWRRSSMRVQRNAPHTCLPRLDSSGIPEPGT